jgi:hypothetical protein
MKHFGTLDDLKGAVARCGLAGAWSYRADQRHHVFRSRCGCVLTWWPKTGTLLVQGRTDPACEITVSDALRRLCRVQHNLFETVVQGPNSGAAAS